jgi:hypothetical protein
LDAEHFAALIDDVVDGLPLTITKVDAVGPTAGTARHGNPQKLKRVFMRHGGH